MEAAADEASETVEELREVAADKGYHSNRVVTDLGELGTRSHISEPNHGQRNWIGKEKNRAALHGNRERLGDERCKRLMRRRGERVERSLAHCYGTGGMRRVHLRGHEIILKRLLIHVGAFNLSLAMRTLVGAGAPRGPAAATRGLKGLERALWVALAVVGEAMLVFGRRRRAECPLTATPRPIAPLALAA